MLLCTEKFKDSFDDIKKSLCDSVPVERIHCIGKIIEGITTLVFVKIDGMCKLVGLYSL